MSSEPKKASPLIKRILEAEATSGVILVIVAILAFIWANSSGNDAYQAMKNTVIGVRVGDGGLEKAAILWVNDLLMAVFFFMVGLEIKRELLIGELVGWQRAALPVVGALGGMVVPAAIYAAFTLGTVYQAGWGIPMATDIAFAVGIMALLGSRVPTSLKVFLLALAIVDDLGAVIVIAVFYTAQINLVSLGISLSVIALSLLYGLSGGHKSVVYALIGAVAWYFMLKSGVHATIAGVLLALTIPIKGPLQRFEHALLPWVSYFIMPVFALFNAGVALGGGGAGTVGLVGPATYGAALGLLIGKPLGIVGLVWLAVKAGIITLPDRVSWMALTGVGLLGGIGFTMSLFVAGLAFPDPAVLDQAKVGVLAGSVIAAMAGLLALHLALRGGGRRVDEDAVAAS